MPFSEFRQGKIYFEATGKGRNLILLHGFMESSEIWQAISRKLSSTFRVVRIDLPGHGNSDCFGYVHSVELMAEATEKVLRDLNIRKCVMLGHSMGGYVTLAFAKKHITRLKGLILFQSTPLADSEEKKADRERIAKIIPGKKEAFIKEALPALFHPDSLQKNPEILQTLEKISLNTSKRGMIAATRGMKNRPDSLEFLQTISLPVFFIMGMNDKVLPVNPHAELWKQISNGELYLLPNCGHIGMLENEQESIKAIKKALRICYKKSKPSKS